LKSNQIPFADFASYTVGQKSSWRSVEGGRLCVLLELHFVACFCPRLPPSVRVRAERPEQPERFTKMFSRSCRRNVKAATGQARSRRCPSSVIRPHVRGPKP